MDPFAPIANVSLDQYAELCALLTQHEGAEGSLASLLHDKGFSIENWSAARSGWTNRLEDPSVGATVAIRFVPAYHAALDRVYGPAPALPMDAYAAISAEIQQHGLATTLGRVGLTPQRFSQIAFTWNVAFSRDPQQYVAYVCMMHVESARLLRGEPARAMPPLSSEAAAQVAPAAAPPHVDQSAPAPAAASAPAQPTAPVPIPKTFEQEASEAANAVGIAFKSGLNKLGGAFDAFGRSLSKPGVGARVLVTWSDGNKYPGTVAEIGHGQFLVTMGDGRQVWIPEPYVSAMG